MRGAFVAVSVLFALAAVSDPVGAAEGSFEEQSLRASQLLPPELVRGPHHAVEEEVASDGFLPVFTVTTEFGSFEARGVEGLRERVAEIEALAALRETSAGLGPETVVAPGPATGETPAPGGAAPGSTAGWGRPVAGWGAPGQGGPTLGAPGQQGYVDLDTMKRRVAHRLGIDPYTPNEQLQRELQQHVWAAYAGKVDSPLTEPETEAEAEGAPRSEGLVRDYSAEDLRRLHRIELAVMGVDEELREAFLENPHYTSRHGARMLDSLAELEGTGDRAAFIEAAAAAGSAEEARGFERMAELMRRYGTETGSLDRFVTIDGRVAAYSADGTLLVPVLGESSGWTSGVASFAESMARAAGQDPEVTKTKLLFSGSLSDRARREMERMGLSVSEDGLGNAPSTTP